MAGVLGTTPLQSPKHARILLPNQPKNLLIKSAILNQTFFHLVYI